VAKPWIANPAQITNNERARKRIPNIAGCRADEKKLAATKGFLNVNTVPSQFKFATLFHPNDPLSGN
jgi:hypothetical protein